MDPMRDVNQSYSLPGHVVGTGVVSTPAFAVAYQTKKRAINTTTEALKPSIDLNPHQGRPNWWGHVVLAALVPVLRQGANERPSSNSEVLGSCSSRQHAPG